MPQQSFGQVVSGVEQLAPPKPALQAHLPSGWDHAPRLALEPAPSPHECGGACCEQSTPAKPSSHAQSPVAASQLPRALHPFMQPPAASGSPSMLNCRTVDTPVT